MAEIYNNTSTSTGNSSVRTAVIRPGEKIILPATAKVTSVVLDGSIDVSSTCDLPAPSTYKCGYFFVIVDQDNNTGSPMNEENTYVASLKVANNLYQINKKLISSGDNPGVLEIAANMNAFVPDQALFSFKRIQRDLLSGGKRQLIYIYFKTPENLFNSVELCVNGYSALQYYKPNVAECGVYEFGTAVGDTPADEAHSVILG